MAHPARVYGYLLGGKGNFAADRALGDAVAEAMPSAREMVHADRAFLGRAVRYLVTEADIRQFLALMTSDPAGSTAFIQAGLHDPDKILGKPVALMLIAILMYVRDEENPRRLVSALMDALPSGSYHTLTHPAADLSPAEVAAAVAATERGGISFMPRPRRSDRVLRRP